MAAIAIITGNLVPLIGVLYWGWKLYDVFYLYWIENIVIGFLTLGRMGLAGWREGAVSFFGGLFNCAFFAFHYGLFCMVHGMIMTDIFHPDLSFKLTETNLFFLPWLLGMEGFIYALGAIILVELFYHYKAIRDDYERSRTVRYIMFTPYGRIVILHLAILSGGLISEAFGFLTAALIILIVLKTLYDLFLFLGGTFLLEESEKQDVAG